MMKKQYEERAKTLVQALEGPLGRRKLQTIVGEHQELLQDLRDQGASWPQIASLLTRAGLRREDAKIVSPAQLRAMFSRVTDNAKSHTEARRALMPAKAINRHQSSMSHSSDAITSMNDTYNDASRKDPTRSADRTSAAKIRDRMQRAKKAREV